MELKKVFQVLGTGADGSGPSLLLSVARIHPHSREGETTLLKRYLFNCGEGTTRFCGEHKIKLQKVNWVFLSLLAPDYCGGFPGLVFSLSECGQKDLNVYGPQGTSLFVESMKSFVCRQFPEISVVEIPNDEGSYLFEDDYAEIVVSAIVPLKPPVEFLVPSCPLEPSHVPAMLDTSSRHANSQACLKKQEEEMPERSPLKSSAPAKFSSPSTDARPLPMGSDGKKTHPQSASSSDSDSSSSGSSRIIYFSSDDEKPRKKILLSRKPTVGGSAEARSKALPVTSPWQGGHMKRRIQHEAQAGTVKQRVEELMLFASKETSMLEQKCGSKKGSFKSTHDVKQCERKQDVPIEVKSVQALSSCIPVARNTDREAAPIPRDSEHNALGLKTIKNLQRRKQRLMTRATTFQKKAQNFICTARSELEHKKDTYSTSSYSSLRKPSAISKAPLKSTHDRTDDSSSASSDGCNIMYFDSEDENLAGMPSTAANPAVVIPATSKPEAVCEVKCVPDGCMNVNGPGMREEVLLHNSEATQDLLPISGIAQADTPSTTGNPAVVILAPHVFEAVCEVKCVPAGSVNEKRTGVRLNEDVLHRNSETTQDLLHISGLAQKPSTAAIPAVVIPLTHEFEAVCEVKCVPTGCVNENRTGVRLDEEAILRNSETAQDLLHISGPAQSSTAANPAVAIPVTHGFEAVCEVKCVPAGCVNENGPEVKLDEEALLRNSETAQDLLHISGLAQDDSMFDTMEHLRTVSVLLFCCRMKETDQPCAVVLSCPTVYHIDVLANHPMMGHKFALPESNRGGMLFHLTPQAVCQHPSYQKLFIAGWAHCIINSSQGGILHRSTTVDMIQHNVICPWFFPLPQNLGVLRNKTRKAAQGNKVGSSLARWNISPQNLRGWDTGPWPPLTVFGDQEYEEKLKKRRKPLNLKEVLHEVIEKLAEKDLTESWKVLNASAAADFKDPVSYVTGIQVVFLGTGCAAPSKHRSSSGIFLRIEPPNPENQKQVTILMDAGEGALGQLQRIFGRAGAGKVVANLDLVWVSHRHGDHHSGLAAVLAARWKHSLNQKEKPASPLVVVAPWVVLEFARVCLNLIGASTEDRSLFILVSIQDFSKPGCPAHEAFFKAHGHLVSDLKSVPVIHCQQAFGLVISLSNGHKVVYSGDTRPCKALIQAGQGATLLIHEATFEDDLVEDAKKKRHSTVNEAIQVAKLMKVRFAVFTHFSQRYPCIPLLQNNVSCSEAIFFFSFDSFMLHIDHALCATQTPWDLLSFFQKWYEEEEDCK